MRAATLACLVLLLLLTAHGRADQVPSDPPQPVFRAGVDLVRVDVTVTGRDDQPLDDLTADDFEVRQNGVLQRIQTLQFVRLTGLPEPGDDLSLEIRSAGHAAQEAARDDVRLLVIFLDDYHLPRDQFYELRVKRMLRELIETELRPLDLLAIMHPLTPMSHLGLTRDRQRLLDAVDEFQGRRGGHVPPRSVLEENQEYLHPRQRARVRAEVSLSALHAAAAHLGSLSERRTSILFISEGPPLYVEGSDLMGELRDVIAAANRANVTIHTLDPRQLGSSSRLLAEANSLLAAETGGRGLGNRNDYSRALSAVMSDASAYYLLGYTPEHVADDGEFHRIDVRVRRRGARVMARRGFWAPAPEEFPAAAQAPPPADVVAAVDSLSAALRPHPVRNWTSIGPVENGRALVTLLFQDAGLDPAAEPLAGVEVEIGAGGDTLDAPRAVRLGEDVWMVRRLLPPGEFSLRVAARTAAGELLDGWTRPLIVPGEHDRDARAGTPLVFRPPTPAAHTALTLGGEGTPTVERRFRRTERVLVRLPLSSRAAPTAVDAALMNAQGDTLVVLPVSRADSGAPHVDLPLTQLASSRYVLRLTATFEDGVSTRLVAFAVVP